MKPRLLCRFSDTSPGVWGGLKVNYFGFGEMVEGETPGVLRTPGVWELKYLKDLIERCYLSVPYTSRRVCEDGEGDDDEVTGFLLLVAGDWLLYRHKFQMIKSK
ncbi:hypothetical protein JW835_09345 [bacterium]|nr:hypothetical protein [bacterium]